MKSLRNLIVFSNYLHFERLPYSNMLMYLSGPSGYWRNLPWKDLRMNWVNSTPCSRASHLMTSSPTASNSPCAGLWHTLSKSEDLDKWSWILLTLFDPFLLHFKKEKFPHELSSEELKSTHGRVLITRKKLKSPVIEHHSITICLNVTETVLSSYGCESRGFLKFTFGFEFQYCSECCSNC